MLRQPFRLSNRIQYYDWGTSDQQAFIPRFLGLTPEPGRPYAELWIGAHPSAPSEIELGGSMTPLNRAIEAAPVDFLGAKAAHAFKNRLPFLLKVLSAGAPLSIQTHPNKPQAVRLHAADPAHYPDDNHKPEIAIALDGLSALAGFRPAEALGGILRSYPEIAHLVGAELAAQALNATNAPAREAGFKNVYASLLLRAGDPQSLQPVVDSIAARLAGLPSPSPEQRYFLEQHRIHGADVGLFSFLLYNLIQLRPGQAIFTGAGIPHAYLKGNIVECMANSDNVVRAGLTSKFKDVKTLLEILDYRFGDFDIINREGKTDGVVYRTPAEEFEVTAFSKSAPSTVSIDAGGGPAVGLVTVGSLTLRWSGDSGEQELAFKRGESFIVPAALTKWSVVCSDRMSFYSVTVPRQA